MYTCNKYLGRGIINTNKGKIIKIEKDKNIFLSYLQYRTIFSVESEWICNFRNFYSICKMDFILIKKLIKAYPLRLKILIPVIKIGIFQFYLNTLISWIFVNSLNALRNILYYSIYLFIYS